MYSEIAKDSFKFAISGWNTGKNTWSDKAPQDEPRGRKTPTNKQKWMHCHY